MNSNALSTMPASIENEQQHCSAQICTTSTNTGRAVMIHAGLDHWNITWAMFRVRFGERKVLRFENSLRTEGCLGRRDALALTLRPPTYPLCHRRPRSLARSG